jgi:hypothetical protein
VRTQAELGINPGNALLIGMITKPSPCQPSELPSPLCHRRISWQPAVAKPPKGYPGRLASEDSEFLPSITNPAKVGVCRSKQPVHSRGDDWRFLFCPSEPLNCFAIAAEPYEGAAHVDFRDET